jgi:hypothetical protein
VILTTLYLVSAKNTDKSLAYEGMAVREHTMFAHGGNAHGDSGRADMAYLNLQ